jgi:dCMP deaminase
MDQRPSWEQYAMNLACEAATRSEDIYRQVGACALDYSNRVIAVGYNGLAPGKNVDPSFWEDRDGRLPYMIHAETNLLSLIKRGEARLVACTLLPCACCATAIAAYEVKKVIYGELYHRDQRSLEIFKFYGIETQHIPPSS